MYFDCAPLQRLKSARAGAANTEPKNDINSPVVALTIAEWLVSRIFRHRLEGNQVAFETLTGCSL